MIVCHSEEEVNFCDKKAEQVEPREDPVEEGQVVLERSKPLRLKKKTPLHEKRGFCMVGNVFPYPGISQPGSQVERAGKMKTRMPPMTILMRKG